MTVNFLFEITDLNSDYCGERFFVQVSKCLNAFTQYAKAWDEAATVVGEDTVIKCLGEFTDEEAEMMGYDTY